MLHLSQGNNAYALLPSAAYFLVSGRCNQDLIILGFFICKSIIK